MISYKLLKKYGINPKSIRKLGNSYMIDDGNRKYLVKKRNDEIDSKFSYLKSRNFDFFPSYFNIEDYDVYDYIEDNNISLEERLYEMVDLISLLHTKTTRYKNIDIDDYKVIYEELHKKIDYLMNYYNELNNQIDSEIYMSPSHYLLVLNMSKLYSALSFCKEELDNWYEIIKNNPKQRQAYIHNNLDISHLISNTNPYLISWNKAKLDIPINDIYDLYRKYGRDIDFDILLNNYQKRYPLKQEELKLLFIKISIPEKIEFDSDEYENTRKVKSVLETLDKGDKLIRPFYEKVGN